MDQREPTLHREREDTLSARSLDSGDGAEGDLPRSWGAGGAGSTARPETASGPAPEIQTGGGGPAHVAALSGLAMVEPPSLATTLASAENGLLTCVHCGLCLPVCPTYEHLGDENDSPRGRLHLMRAVVEGRLDAGSDAFRLHIDRCLGCRACEPVCPSGVPFGSLLELARAERSAARRPRLLERWFLRVFESSDGIRGLMSVSRVLRGTGIPALLARFLPSLPGTGRLKMALGMLAASASWRGVRGAGRDVRRSSGGVPVAGSGRAPAGRPGMESTVEEESVDVFEARVVEVGMLEGCVQAGLFSHVNDATVRTLEANGMKVQPAPDQRCCGAIHAHGGDLATARELARRNIEAFERAGVEQIVVNAAGCGAIMKEYGYLLSGDPGWADRAARTSAMVRDVSEVLAPRGPRSGASVGVAVAYDAPCHLLHAQGVEDPPRRVLESVPGLELVELEGSEDCCGGAGIYGLLNPDLGGRIGGAKVEAVRRSGARMVATGNPGCIMQIGAGLRMAGVDCRVVHPVEILDESYRRAGMYGEPDS